MGLMRIHVHVHVWCHSCCMLLHVHVSPTKTVKIGPLKHFLPYSILFAHTQVGVRTWVNLFCTVCTRSTTESAKIIYCICCVINAMKIVTRGFSVVYTVYV